MSKTVLLLEDDPTSMFVLRTVLNNGGYRVLEAQSAREAIECCEKYNGGIDLLVSDVVLRASDGPEATRRMKEVRPDMAVLFISGHPEDELLNRGLIEAEELSKHQTCFLRKPFAAAVLRDKVRQLIENS